MSQSPDQSHAYRPCVGIMVLNRDGLVWIGRRPDAPAEPEGPGAWWQMPQGGIDASEDPAKAALRELEEETGIRSVEIIAESPGWYTYDLPAELRPKAWGGRYRGQTQKWFAARFTGARRGGRAGSRPGTTQEFDRMALGRHRRAGGADRALQARRLRAGGARLRRPRPAAAPALTARPQSRGCGNGLS